MKINVTNLGIKQINEVIDSLTGTVRGFSQLGGLVFLEVDKTPVLPFSMA